LQLNGAGSIASSPLVSVTNGATLDVSGLDSPFNVVEGQTLGGSGTINGNVNADGTISPGPSSGTLSILTFNNNLTFDGSLVLEVNTSLSPSNDVISANSVANTGTGTLTINNLGPGLTAGQQFYLFTAPVLGGNALTIVPPPGVTFANHLALDGSLTVLSVIPINPNPTNLSYTVSANILHLTWPADHLGWLVQSNAVSLANQTAWHDVPNSQSSTSLSVPLNPAIPQVFYRLRHP
jgi:hypothetical protein